MEPKNLKVRQGRDVRLSILLHVCLYCHLMMMPQPIQLKSGLTLKREDVSSDHTI